ncbi:helix-turn-helix domain-containing protein [Microbacterium sp. SA39]|uniref:helix-turn-helix domain-containing protein n=1 Tax=Microbacterium sp. SA39 TaxID=1263625 RepID=UPI0005F9C912|nr:helix-turn-helix transcriptional regulator [Microbacterium sp. SA39]KJQ54415.1 hypothetical protein RS85_01567 [Microbacterium sp. SA39]
MLDTGDERPTAFAEAFSAAISARRVTLSWLQRRLKDRANPISVATLSYWRSGERHPEGFRSLTVLEDIERLLGLDAGALVGLVDTRTRLGSLSAAQNPFTECEVTQAAEETLRILDAPPIEFTRSLSAHVVSTVGENGLLESRTSQVLVQAVAPVVEEMTYALMSADAPVRRPACTLRGATLVREHLHESEHVYACVLRLDRPLAMGDTTMLEISMAVPPPEEGQFPRENETAGFVMRPIRNLVLWTRFHPAAVPDWLYEFERTPAAPRPTTTRTLTPAESIHQSRRDFGPGILGIRWGSDR